jgi:hypothetical protein
MLDYPWSIIGYLVFGMLGAFVFLFLLLLFDKKVEILDNEALGTRGTGILYVLLGGVLALVVNLASSMNFTAGQMSVAFGAGLAWPAIAAGVGAGKRVGKISDEKDQVQGEATKAMNQAKDNEDTAETWENRAKTLIAAKDAAIEEVRKYFTKDIEDMKRYHDLALDQAEEEKEKIEAFYKNKLVSLGGG